MSKPAQYFEIYELLPPERYKLMGEEGWCLFDQKLIDTIDFIREKTDLPITINDWFWGGKKTLRGWRPQDCKIGAAKSAHKEGRAVDFMVGKWTADDFRSWLIDNAGELPHPIRCELGTSWCHVDVRIVQGHKIYFFKP